MEKFEGKVALVTGGGSGIGRATALAFARGGAQVVIGNRTVQRGEDVVRAIREAGGEASFMATDVSVEADVEALVEHTVSTFGRLDMAFNNAGIEGEVGPLTEQTEANYQSVMDINVKGVWLSMKHEISRMLEQGGGTIVNCSSAAGVVGFRGLGIYVASKHAVNGLTKTAALEYSTQGIRVNSVNPAVIATAMSDRLLESVQMTEDEMAALHPIGRIGQVDEVAQTVLWLCSESASFISGHALLVDGGYAVQ